MLQVSVTVEVRSQDGQEKSEETQTVVVNAHGGLMKLRMLVKAGQPILLRNEKTKAKQLCHVVRVETSDAAGSSAVAFEFDQPAPQFWPITFPPADWNPRN